MLANNLTITVDGAPYVLVRVREDKDGSVYQLKTATYLQTLRVRQSIEPATAKSPAPVNRSNVFFEQTTFATPTVSARYYSVSLVMRYADASDPVYLGKILTGFNTLAAAQAASVIGGEV